MRTYRFVALLLLIFAFALFTRNNAHALGRRGHHVSFQTAAPKTLLQIQSPKPGEKIQSDVVTVQYSMVRAADAEPTPTYELRIDSSDPVQTASTTYTFTGLQPGEHTIDVQAVDANNTPIAGTQAQVRFAVLPPPGSATPAKKPSEELNQAATLPDPNEGALSLLSVIGFGILVGGALSLYRGRALQEKRRRIDD